MKAIIAILAAAAALASAAHAEVRLQLGSTTADAPLAKSERGVRVWRGSKPAAPLKLAGADPRKAPVVIAVTIDADCWRAFSRLRTQGFYSGHPGQSRRFTQGFWSDAAGRS